MQIPPLTKDEPARLAALRATCQLDTPIEGRFEVITRIAKSLFNVPIAAVSLVDTDRQWFKSIQGLDVEQTGRDISFCGHTIQNDEVMVVSDARQDPRFADNPLVTGPPNIVFYAGCPIRAVSGGNIATLCLIDTKARQMSDEELVKFRDIAAMAQLQLNHSIQESVACDLIHQIEAEKRKALIDPLTRIWNRDGIDELLERQVRECGKQNRGMAVVMADLDHFKKINDKYGHLVGDEVLREVARRLLTVARPCDHVGRFGGEEFIVVLGGCDDPQVARDLAESLRKQVRDNPVQTSAGDIDITSSFGVHYAPTGGRDSAEDLIRDADSALYRAKTQGRDRVSLHTPASSAA